MLVHISEDPFRNFLKSYDLTKESVNFSMVKILVSSLAQTVKISKYIQDILRPFYLLHTPFY